MEEAQEEKREWNQCNEKCSSNNEPEDGRKSHTSENSDELEKKLRTFGVMKENEQINNELEGHPNQSNPNAASDEGARTEKFDCEVCGKQFSSLKAVHGHTKLHTGKKKATEVGSNGCEGGSYSLRAKKHPSTFKLPRKPDSGSPQNPVPNSKSHGGEASSSRQIEREKSRNKRDVDVHGHMKLLSGKNKRAVEVGSNGCEEEGSYSLRGRKLTSTFKLARKPDSRSPQNPVPNGKPQGDEASSSRPKERGKSRNKKDVDVHGHMKLHSGKKKVAEDGSLRTRKHPSITFKPPRKPDSDAPQNPDRNGKSHGGQASRSRQMERQRSSIVSGPSPVFDQVMIEIAPYLLKLSDFVPDRRFAPPNHPNDDPRKE